MDLYNFYINTCQAHQSSNTLTTFYQTLCNVKTSRYDNSFWIESIIIGTFEICSNSIRSIEPMTVKDLKWSLITEPVRIAICAIKIGCCALNILFIMPVITFYGSHSLSEKLATDLNLIGPIIQPPPPPPFVIPPYLELLAECASLGIPIEED
jgi:hypothetical protein